MHKIYVKIIVIPQNTVRYKLDTKGPIELELLTESLQIFAKEFHRETKGKGVNPDDAKTRLFVKSVSNGSIIADLVPLLTGTAGLVVTGLTPEVGQI